MTARLVESVCRLDSYPGEGFPGRLSCSQQLRVNSESKGCRAGHLSGSLSQFTVVSHPSTDLSGAKDTLIWAPAQFLVEELSSWGEMSDG